jgi:hypothetical protein
MLRPIHEEIVIRSIKLLDIGYAAAVYFMVALLCVKLLNWRVPADDLERNKKKATVTLCLEIVLKVWFIGVLAYVVRNLFELVPWPFQGVYGYDHLKVKEVTNSAIFVAFMVVFDASLQNKVKVIKERFNIK